MNSTRCHSLSQPDSKLKIDCDHQVCSHVMESWCSPHYTNQQPQQASMSRNNGTQAPCHDALQTSPNSPIWRCIYNMNSSPCTEHRDHPQSPLAQIIPMADSLISQSHEHHMHSKHVLISTNTISKKDFSQAALQRNDEMRQSLQ
jgi:hypothetical protein